jgi:2-octaprenyl-6-methoxyphenol hydroxylase
VRIDRWTVAIGNAAQTLHPVAGQGLNLGLRDAWVLARCLGDALAQSRRRQPAHGVSDSAREPSAIGHEDFVNALDRHEMLRRHDRRSMVAITDTLASLTRAQAMLPLQSLALAGLELCTALKRRARTTFTHGWREL